MTNGNPRLWAILTVLAGLVVIGVTLGFSMLPEVATGRAAGCYAATPPIIAFEFARTLAEASALFGTGECRPLTLTAMDAANHLDIIAYIPAYTLFAIFGAIFAARGGRPRLVLLAILAAIGAFVGDMVETTTLLAITKDMAEATDAMTVRASTAAWIKFGLLGAYAALMAGVCLTASPKRWIVGLVFVLPVLGTIAAAVDKIGLVSAMTLGTVVAWMVLLLFALKESVWPVKRG